MTMIEKVARALAKRNYEMCYYDPEERDKLVIKDVDEKWKLFVDEAKAAIEALREPTPELLKIASDHLHTYSMWQAIIDEMLKDG